MPKNTNFGYALTFPLRGRSTLDEVRGPEQLTSGVRPIIGKIGRLAAIGLLSLASLGWLAGAAAAHTGFKSSDPTDGALITGTLDEITLTFTDTAEPAGEGFVVLDGSGELRLPTQLESNEEKTEWVLSFEPPLAPGPAGLRWTVQARDAHPIEGSFSFVVAAEAEPSVQEEDSDQETDTGSTIERFEPTGNTPIPQDRSQLISEQLAGESELTEFLDQPESAASADAAATTGRAMGLVGTMMVIGGLFFGVYVIGNRRTDLVVVLKIVAAAAWLVIIGSMFDLLGRLAMATNESDGGWGGVWSTSALNDLLNSSYGLSIGLRVGAGLAFAVLALHNLRKLPLHVHTVPAPSGSGDAVSGNHKLASPLALEERTTGISLSPTIIVATSILLASYTFDGHTTTEGNRLVTAAVDVAHVLAAGVWVGGVVAFAIVLWHRRRRGQTTGALEFAVRFSVIAGASLALAGAAGVALTAVILNEASDLWTTPWGRLLMAKVVLVAAAAIVGGYNHFAVIPSLQGETEGGRASKKLRTTVTAEAILLVAVAGVTAVLVGASSL